MAAVAHASHLHAAPPAPPSPDGGDESPIFYPLDTPAAPGMKPAERAEASPSRRGSLDDGLRRFQRASSDPAGGPPSSQVASTKLDQEHNPFEQSFSSKPTDNKLLRRARSQSPVSAARTPPVPGQPKLPPLAALASPSPTHGTGISHFGWGFDASLRSGPLSPAMLTAPTNPPGHLFDPNSMRTGFTPQVASNTWGPDTPGTAAFFASLTHGTPDAPSTAPPGAAGMAAAATRQHRDGPNHFEANFARAISGSQLPTVGGNPDVSLYQTQAMPRPLGPPGAVQQPPSTATMTAAVLAARAGEANMYGQHNPLYLLSQGVVQHELANSADDTVIAAAALSHLTSSAQQAGPSGYAIQPHLQQHGQAPPLATMAPMQPMPLAPAPNGVQRPPTLQTRKTGARGSANGSPPNSAASTGGRKRKGAAANNGDIETTKPAKAARGGGGKRAAKARSESVDFDEMGDYGEDDDGEEPRSPRMNASGKPETDEEKRKNFLERNRQAALKCRQRKKAWLQSLQAKVEYLTSDNETLQSTVNALREEIAALRAVLVAHKDCPVQMPNAPGPTTVAAALAQPLQQQQQQQRYA